MTISEICRGTYLNGGQGTPQNTGWIQVKKRHIIDSLSYKFQTNTKKNIPINKIKTSFKLTPSTEGQIIEICCIQKSEHSM